jgi:hypothetical protein
MTAEKPYLTTLNTLLGDRAKDVVYLCIRDLLDNGLDLARFSPGDNRPQRQDITQFLAAWSRHAGLSEEESRSWLIEYCTTVLEPISSRTPAAIRHSTKSNLKYIYNSAVPFLCDCEKNQFRAQCGTSCPVHAEMLAKFELRIIEAANPKPIVRPPPPTYQPYLSVKKQHAEQFQKAMLVAVAEVEKGTKLNHIVTLLNTSGLKSRTGRQWRYGTLHSELEKWRRSPPPAQSGGETANPPVGPAAEPGAPADAHPTAPPANPPEA